MALRVELVSPERILYSGEAEMVVVRTLGGGEIAFMPGHAPFVGALAIATATLRTPQGDELVAVHGGFVEVSNDTVTILSDVAELASQIDVERAQRAKERAEERLRAARDAEAEAALRRALIRLQTAGNLAAVS
ncbi:MAG: ATP synthase F1 subunit epsilon [Acidimicrobiia bacterium]|nr:ATP synthase F1 subunit epsilon [Thermoanaerobacterales bacterium]